MSSSRFAILIPAAGRGSRFGGDLPKVEWLLQNKPVFAHALDIFLADNEVNELILALSPGDEARFRSAHAQWLTDKRIHFCEGGAERWQTVRNMLTHIAGDATHVVIHDAARPLLPQEVWQRLKSACKAGAKAVFPALPAQDTLRSKVDDTHAGTIIPRDSVLQVQTPQCLRMDVARNSFSKAHTDTLDMQTITDDIALAQSLGIQPEWIMGDPRLMKLTRAHDVPFIEGLLAQHQRTR